MKDLTTIKLNDIYAKYDKETYTKAAIEWLSIFNTISDLRNKIEYLKFLCKKEGMIVDPFEEKETL